MEKAVWMHILLERKVSFLTLVLRKKKKENRIVDRVH